MLHKFTRQVFLPALKASTMRGYWSSVYLRARAILEEHPELTGDEAYRLARRAIDEAPPEGGDN